MRFSQLFAKTAKTAPQEADSANAQLLTRAGFIHQEMAGVYTYLPLGLKVLRKIEAIIRSEMEGVGGQEILMPALTPKANWEATGRWANFDALFRLEGVGGKEYALGATHEEIVTPLGQHYTFSYKDLPFAVFQIQNKFRNEPRAKSGLLRGREFSMKDLYSFHLNQEDLDEYYEKVKKAYLKTFQKLGFDSSITYLTYASGGAFSQFSHEFQVFTEVGEDTIYCCENCKVAINKEIIDSVSSCPECTSKNLIEKKGVEIGNIFKLATRFSDAFGFKVNNESGQSESVKMGCYGMGPSRIMGTLVELLHDEKGIKWPKSVAPFQVHLVGIAKDDETQKQCNELYQNLLEAGIEVLYDDREKVQAGAKFADADLIGIPLRLVLSSRTVEQGGVEWKERNQTEASVIPIEGLIDKIKTYYTS